MMAMINKPLGEFPLFEGLNSRERRRVVGALRSRIYKAGEVVFHEGDPGDKLFVVKEGLVRIYTGGRENGLETSVIIFGKPGDVFGELAIIDGEPRSASAKAIEDTVVYTMSREHFQHHMEGIPQLAYNFLRQMSKKIRKSTNRLDNFASKPVIGRLASMITSLMDERSSEDDGKQEVEIGLNQTEIASHIFATRESTNRAINELKKKE